MSGPVMPGAPWLVIVEEDFLPADSGGRVESLNIVGAVAASGIAMTLVIPGITDAPSYRARFPGVEIVGTPRRTGPMSHLSAAPYVFRSRPIAADVLESIAQQHQNDPFEVVLAASFRVAEMGKIVADELDVPLIVRAHNIESEYFRQLSRSSGRLKSVAYLAESVKMKRAERAVHQWDRVALFADISDDESRARQLLTSTPTIAIPPFSAPSPGVEVHPVRETGRTVLFLGTLDNPNNVAAVEWFTERCWPQLQADVEDVVFNVVGRRAPVGLAERLRAAGVGVTVDAPEIESHLANADVFINPVQRGAGVNIKMIDAMRAGIPVVSSPVGARGVGWRSDEQLLLADSPDDFVAAVTGLLRDPARRGRLARGAARFLAEELNPVNQIGKLRDHIVRVREKD